MNWRILQLPLKEALTRSNQLPHTEQNKKVYSIGDKYESNITYSDVRYYDQYAGLNNVYCLIKTHGRGESFETSTDILITHTDAIKIIWNYLPEYRTELMANILGINND